MKTSIIDKANELRDRLILSDVVESYGVSLSGSGSELKGLCPFHEESTPSFHVNDSKGKYHCFGCGAGGDVIKFVRQINGGIGFAEAVRQLSGEFESLRNSAPKRKRIKQESPKCNPLPVEARHDSHKKLVKAFGLASWRKNHLIKDRGLTPDEVKWCIEQGFIFDWEPGANITGVSRQLAGVDPNNGQLVGELGMAIAAFNPTSQATGYQIKPDKPKEKGRKYVWASTSWLGNSIHLPNGDAPLFVWKHGSASEVREVWLCEGALKSLLVALRLWREGKYHIAVIGTATSANYPDETFKQYLTQLNPHIVRLFPDAGVGDNPGVRAANLQTIAQVSEFGFEVVVGWWGQFEKSPDKSILGDIDEIADWSRIQYLSPDEFKRQLGVDEDVAVHRANHSRRLSLISKQEWWEKFGFPQKVEKFADLLANKINKKLLRENGFAKQNQPIAPPLKSTLTEGVLKYVPGELPDLLDWAKMGYPDIRVSDGDDIEFAREAIAFGYKHILNAKSAGSGKSYTFGKFTPEKLGLEIPRDKSGKVIKSLQPQIFYLDPNYRNPSTETVEANFTQLPGRHAGLSYDHNRKTSLGKPYLVKTPDRKKPDIERNCRDAESFIYSNTKGRPIFGGKNSPLCETCPEYVDADGQLMCSLLLDKIAVLEEADRITADPNTIPQLKKQNVIGGVEEALKTLAPTKSVQILPKDIVEVIRRIKKRDDKSAKLLTVLLRKTYTEIMEFDSKNKRHGADHREATEAILLSRVEIESLNPAGVEWNPTPRYDLPCLPPGEQTFGEEKPVRIPSRNSCDWKLFKLKLQLARERFEKWIWKIYGDDFIQAESAWGNPLWKVSFDKGEEINTFIGWRWAAPSFDDIIDECKRLMGFSVDSLATPDERLEGLKKDLLAEWIPSMLKILSGDRRHSLRLDEFKLTVTRPHRRHEQIVKGFQTTFYLDATATKEALATAINLQPKDISRELERLNSELAIAQQMLDFALRFDPRSVEERQKTVGEIEAEIDLISRTHAQQHILKVIGEEENYTSLKHTIVGGIGKCGHQRYSKDKNGKLNIDSKFALANRIANLVKAIAFQNQGKNIALFDHKAFIDSNSPTFNPAAHELQKQGLIHNMSVHFRDSRGINRLADCNLLIRVGRPVPNLGEMAAQWQAMTGQIVKPTQLTGAYGEWVRNSVVAEDIQEIARLRANRRPGEELEVINLGDYSESDIEAIANYFTGSTVEKVDAYDLCPESARKGVQTERGIIEAIWAAVQSGLKITTSQVAEIVGVSRSRVSQIANTMLPSGFRRLVEVLEMLYNALNSKTNTLDELELTSEELWAAREFLPAVLRDLLSGDTDPETLATDIVKLAKHYGSRSMKRIFRATPLKTLLSLFESLLFEANQKIPILTPTD